MTNGLHEWDYSRSTRTDRIIGWVCPSLSGACLGLGIFFSVRFVHWAPIVGCFVCSFLFQVLFYRLIHRNIAGDMEDKVIAKWRDSYPEAYKSATQKAHDE